MELTLEEKKVAIEAEIEKQRQIQSILDQRENDPPGMEKGDRTKHYCPKYIEATTVTEEMDDFEKVLKKTFATENTDYNQLNFLINKMMFLSSQYQIAKKFDEEEFKRMKYRFHAVPGKKEEEIWSLVKIF